MGTINYGTSDYITLGIEPLDAWTVEHDSEFMEEIRAEVAEYGGTVEDAINDYINGCAEDDYINIQTELNKHSFYYFHVAIKNGYYDGFYLDIESNFGIAYDSWQDKREAQKEITELKQFLITCAGMGLCEVWPGWCTKYHDYNHTINAINEAIKAMREDVKSTPTWAQYEREGV